MYLRRRIERAADVAVEGECALIEAKGVQLFLQRRLEVCHVSLPINSLRNLRTLELLRVKDAILDHFV